MRTILVAVLCSLVAAGLPAQQPPGCSHETSHDFDFWIGEWDVYAGQELAGTNSIRPILDGCVLQETWRGAQGSAGSSFNFFNPQKGAWQQFWVWRNGTTLELEGRFADGTMVLSGSSVDREGTAIENRISWHDNTDGTVRQHWEQSRDGGASWQTVFDGLYRRRQ